MLEQEHVGRPASARGRARSWWARVEPHVATPYAAAALLAVALCAYAVEALAWPLAPGRDLGDYLVNYAQMFDAHPVLPAALLGRTPISPLVVGGSLDVSGWFAQAVMAVLYAGSILAWSAAALRFSRPAAVVTAICLLLYPGYAALFHHPSGDAVYAAGFAGFALLAVRATSWPSVRRFAVLGLGVAVLSLIRPTSQVLVLLAVTPLLLGGSWRRRLGAAAAFVAALALPVLAWSAYNDVRFDDFTIQRGGEATVPFFRALLVDHIVEPSNGPASRELARAIERHLLPVEPYRSYGITLDDVFRAGDVRMEGDLISLSDRLWGWGSDQRKLLDVGLEAVRAHPGAYAEGVAKTIGDELWLPLYVIPPGRPGGPRPDSPTATPTASPRQETIVVGGRRLPKPSEGMSIPASHQNPRFDTPDDRIREVWTSPADHRLVFRDPADAGRYARLNAKVAALFAAFPHTGRNAELALRLNQASRWYPRPAIWLALGLVALAIRRPRRLAGLVVVALAALLVLLFTAFGVYAVPEYAVPVVPAFILLAVAGSLGVRGEPHRSIN